MAASSVIVPFVATALGIMGAVQGNGLAGLASVLALSLELYYWRRDFILVKTAVFSLVDPLSKRNLRRDEPVHRESEIILDHIQALRIRLDSQQWEVEQREGSAPDLDEDVVFAAEDEGISRLYGTVLEMAASKFRCMAVAIAVKEPEGICVFSQGLKGAKFERSLEHFLSQYFNFGDKSVFGIHDCLEKESVLGDLSFFGVRFTISYPFDARVGKGVLWLGYRDGVIPSQTEDRWVKALSEKLGSAVQAKEKFSKLYEEIREAQSDKETRSKFFANLSHDIRTPLNNLKNILALVRFEETSKETLEMLDSAMENCDQMAELVQDILYYSRFQLGALSANRRPFNLVNMASKTCESFRASADLKGLSLKFVGGTEPIFAEMDPKHFRRILSNFISNALKYTKAGCVSVVVGRDKDKVFVSVRDTGVGLSRNEIEGLFVPFKRFDTTGQDGIGLGLALSKALAEVNGAEIKVSSVPGEGSEFTIAMPEADRESLYDPEGMDLLGIKERVRRLKEKALLTHPHRKGILVLVIDDDEDTLKSYERMLCLAGFDVELAKDSKEAESTIRGGRRIGFVLSDYCLKEGHAGEIVDLCCRRNIPCVLVSGSEQVGDVESLVNKGAMAFFKKPVDMADVISFIDSTISENRGEPKSSHMVA
ncbi:MAG: response regulator [Candidatus Dadabacteria bacterium]|nr:MAG: response regulator [Candidatus Dadabacteria bacterium]